MTATDELRRMLDERGVEWQAPNSCQRDEITHFRASGDYGGTWWEAYEMSDGTFQMSSEIYDELTPEQAIAATLGSELPYDELMRCLENDWNISASWDGLRKFWCIELTEEGVKLRNSAHSTLTAEQVRDVIEVAKAEMLESCKYLGDYEQRTNYVLKAFGKMEQEIAATMGGGKAMNVPEKLEVPVVVKDTDGNEHEVERLVYRLERNGKSRWAELFGTPERAAEYFAMQCFGSDGSLCYYCPFDDCDERLRNIGAYQSVHEEMLEWLRGDA